MDTVLGKKGTLACLLVLTERKTRLQLIRKLENRTALHTEERIKGLIEEYPDSIKTLTSDNGSEFMKVDEIEGLGVGYFYGLGWFNRRLFFGKPSSHTRLRQLGASRTGFYPSLILRSTFVTYSAAPARRLSFADCSVE